MTQPQTLVECTSHTCFVAPCRPLLTREQHLDLLKRVLTRDLATLERLYDAGLVSFPDVEECRAALESVAALRGLV